MFLNMFLLQRDTYTVASQAGGAFTFNNNRCTVESKARGAFIYTVASRANLAMVQFNNIYNFLYFWTNLRPFQTFFQTYYMPPKIANLGFWNFGPI